MRPVPDILKNIKESLGKANTVMWQGFGATRGYKVDRESEEIIRYFLDRAFLQTLFFLEVQGLPRMQSYLEETYQLAKGDYARIDVTPEGEPYLAWGDELRLFLDSIDATLGEPTSTAISKDIIEILKNCQYAITDPCFSVPPRDERQVHERIEAVLRCIFPDLLRKPPISKPIKNFEPDTGLPSVRSLIEYKFISTNEDAKRVAEEVLADTRGYVSKEWEKFIYVIYETRRIKPEFQWTQLLRASGLGDNTKAIVISGEPTTRRKKRGIAGKAHS